MLSIPLLVLIIITRLTSACRIVNETCDCFVNENADLQVDCTWTNTVETLLDFSELIIEGQNISFRVNIKNKMLKSLKSSTYPLNSATLERVIVLDVANNKIKTLEASTFIDFKSLLELYLSQNEIEFLWPGTFERLASLKTLDLSWNKLKLVQNETFCGLINLENLFIDQNLLNSFEANSFDQLKQLKEAKAIGNKLEQLEIYGSAIEIFHLQNNDLVRVVFGKMFSLKVLLLYFNKLEKITSRMFRSLGNLTTLWLNNNNIYYIEENAFQDLISMEELLLYSNKLSIIQQATFKNLPKLKSLSLRQNNISIIENYSFESLTSLQSLLLAENKLKTLSSLTFARLSSLEVLFLQNNELVDFEENVFKETFALKKLILYNNRLESIKKFYFLNLTSLAVLWLHENR